jgi:hypothetical protein
MTSLGQQRLDDLGRRIRRNLPDENVAFPRGIEPVLRLECGAGEL